MRSNSCLILNLIAALISLGAHIRSGAAVSGAVDVTVHKGTKSLLVLVAGTRPTSYIISSIQDPAGNVYRADIHDERLVSNPYYPGYATAMVLPALGERALNPGTWKMRVKAEDKGSARDQLDVRIFENRGPATKEKSLRLNLVFTGSFGLTTKTFPGSAVERGVRELAEMFLKYGLRVELGTLSDFPLSHQEVVFEPGAGGTTVEDLVHLPVARARGLNIIFVESLDFGAAQGVSPGAPGIFVDSPHAGLVVASNRQDPLVRLKPMGLLLAHEVGHFLGLKHTYEVDETAPTTAPEIYNIMNPDTFLRSALSSFHFRPDQVRIIKEHPLLQ